MCNIMAIKIMISLYLTTTVQQTYINKSLEVSLSLILIFGIFLLQIYFNIVMWKPK